jgi:predicted nucleotidyltransferase
MSVGAALAGRARQRDAWLADAARRLGGDERVAAAWLFGSLARGDGDELSDVDLFVAFDDGSADELDRVDVWLGELGELTRWREDPYNAPDRGRYFEAVCPADPIPLVVDSYWQPVSASLLGADTQVLFDRVGVRRAAPGLTTYALIPAVRDGSPLAEPDDPATRLRGRVQGFWSDLAIVAKHHARRWGHAHDEAAALWSMMVETAADVGVAADRRRRADGLRALLGEMDRVLAAAGFEEVIDAAGRANAQGWLGLCEALRREGWTPRRCQGWG